MATMIARTQLNFIRGLVTRFARPTSTLRDIAAYQAEYIAIVALLRSVGHVFQKVDCVTTEQLEWSRSNWSLWNKEEIFRDFIEPTRNRLLKEFQGGLAISSEAISMTAVVADPSIPEGVAHVVAFEADKMLDFRGRPALTQIHQSMDYWDRFLGAAENAFAKMA